MSEPMSAERLEEINLKVVQQENWNWAPNPQAIWRVWHPIILELIAEVKRVWEENKALRDGFVHTVKEA